MATTVDISYSFPYPPSICYYLFFKIFNILFYQCLHAYMCSKYMPNDHGNQGGVGHPGTGVQDGYGPPYEYWKLNLDLLEEPPVL